MRFWLHLSLERENKSVIITYAHTYRTILKMSKQDTKLKNKTLTNLAIQTRQVDIKPLSPIAHRLGSNSLALRVMLQFGPPLKPIKH